MNIKIEERRVFWPNIVKFGVYLRYRHCSKLFRELRKESEFRKRCCRNSTKVWERKRKSGREKILNFGNHITEIPATQTYWPKINCGNAIAKIGKNIYIYFFFLVIFNFFISLGFISGSPFMFCAFKFPISSVTLVHYSTGNFYR